MSVAVILSVLGLSLGCVSAFLIYLFPPRVQLYTEKGEGIINWVTNPQEGKKHIGKWQIRLTKVGPALLVIAFLLQLAGVLVSVKR